MNTATPWTQPCFPFIVGCGRSGTTLVRAMLDSHPELAIPPETKFIATLGSTRRKYEKTKGFDVEAFVVDLQQHVRLGVRLGLTHEEVAEAFSEQPPVDYPDAVRRVFSLMARQRGKTRYGNKSPIHVLTIPLLAELFPESRFIHVIRDGRDVACSYLSVDWGPDTVVDAALRWRRAVRKGREAGRQLGPGRYKEVRYEILVDDPEAELRTLCSFLDLPFNSVMLQYSDRAPEILDGVAFPEAHRSLSLPPTKGLRDWMREMSRSDVARFESIAGRTLSAAGYERAVTRIRPDIRVAAYAAELSSHTQRLRHHIRRPARKDRTVETSPISRD